MPTPTGHPAIDLLLLTAAVLVALGTVKRYVWPTLCAAYRLLRTIDQGATDYHLSGGFAGIKRRDDEMAAEISAIKKELHPNGGGSLRDAVDKAATEARTAAEEAARIGKVTEGLDRRLIDVREVVDAQTERLVDTNERISDHRRRNQETVERIEQYLIGERVDLLEAKQGLEASVHELLGIPDDPPDHQPDLD